MNQNDINRAFTEKVTELLSRGYQIHPGTMGGSQGEIAHVDLYRGDEIIRVLLDHSAGRGEKPDGVRLVVGRNTDRIRIRYRKDVKPGMWVRFQDEKWIISTLGEYSFKRTYLGLKASIAEGVSG